MFIIYFMIIMLIAMLISASKMNTKLCTNCRFYIRPFFSSSEFGKCTKFTQNNTDDYFLVNGINDNRKNYYYCVTARREDDMCGQEGKFYEKK